MLHVNREGVEYVGKLTNLDDESALNHCTLQFMMGISRIVIIHLWELRISDKIHFVFHYNIAQMLNKNAVQCIFEPLRPIFLFSNVTKQIMLLLVILMSLGISLGLQSLVSKSLTHIFTWFR